MRKTSALGRTCMMPRSSIEISCGIRMGIGDGNRSALLGGFREGEFRGLGGEVGFGGGPGLRRLPGEGPADRRRVADVGDPCSSRRPASLRAIRAL